MTLWPLYALAIVFTALAAWCATRTDGDRPYADPRCAGPARYEAMAEGADCFNPPRGSQ